MVVKAREKKKKERDGWIVLFFSEEEIPMSVLFVTPRAQKKDTRTYKAKVLHTNTKRSRDDDDDDD